MDYTVRPIAYIRNDRGEVLDDNWDEITSTVELAQDVPSDALRGLLSVSGVIGTWAGPRSAGSAYVTLHHHIGDVDGKGGADESALYRKLLELNAKQLIHAAYGLDETRIVLSGALELENLDFNELQATLDEIDMALPQQLPGYGQPAHARIEDAYGP